MTEGKTEGKKGLASERVNIRLNEDERVLLNDLAAELQIPEKEVLMQGLSCLAKQTGRRPLKARELRNQFFKKGEAQALVLKILGGQDAPISTLEIIDKIIQGKGRLDTEQMGKLSASLSVNIQRMERAGLVLEVYKEKNVSHWKIAKPNPENDSLSGDTEASEESR